MKPKAEGGLSKSNLFEVFQVPLLSRTSLPVVPSPHDCLACKGTDKSQHRHHFHKLLKSMKTFRTTFKQKKKIQPISGLTLAYTFRPKAVERPKEVKPVQTQRQRTPNVPLNLKQEQPVFSQYRTSKKQSVVVSQSLPAQSQKSALKLQLAEPWTLQAQTQRQVSRSKMTTSLKKTAKKGSRKKVQVKEAAESSYSESAKQMSLMSRHSNAVVAVPEAQSLKLLDQKIFCSKESKEEGEPENDEEALWVIDQLMSVDQSTESQFRAFVQYSSNSGFKNRVAEVLGEFVEPGQEIEVFRFLKEARAKIEQNRQTGILTVGDAFLKAIRKLCQFVFEQEEKPVVSLQLILQQNQAKTKTKVIKKNNQKGIIKKSNYSRHDNQGGLSSLPRVTFAEDCQGRKKVREMHSKKRGSKDKNKNKKSGHLPQEDQTRRKGGRKERDRVSQSSDFSREEEVQRFIRLGRKKQLVQSTCRQLHSMKGQQLPEDIKELGSGGSLSEITMILKYVFERHPQFAQFKAQFERHQMQVQEKKKAIGKLLDKQVQAIQDYDLDFLCGAGMEFPGIPPRQTIDRQIELEPLLNSLPFPFCKVDHKEDEPYCKQRYNSFRRFKRILRIYQDHFEDKKYE